MTYYFYNIIAFSEWFNCFTLRKMDFLVYSDYEVDNYSKPIFVNTKYMQVPIYHKSIISSINFSCHLFIFTVGFLFYLLIQNVTNYYYAYIYIY